MDDATMERLAKALLERLLTGEDVLEVNMVRDEEERVVGLRIRVVPGHA